MAAKKSLPRGTKGAVTKPRPAGGPAPRPTGIAKVVIFFMENHTTDNYRKARLAALSGGIW
jgi:hypothetical protein